MSVITPKIVTDFFNALSDNDKAAVLESINTPINSNFLIGRKQKIKVPTKLDLVSKHRLKNRVPGE